MQRISSEYPGYPVRVLSGDLVENPTTTGEMMRNHPTMREFFVRLAKTTGQAVGQDFLRRLEPGQGDVSMQAFYLQAVFFQVAVFRTYDEGDVLAGFLKPGSVVAAEGSGSQNGDFHGVR